MSCYAKVTGKSPEEIKERLHKQALARKQEIERIEDQIYKCHTKGETHLLLDPATPILHYAWEHFERQGFNVYHELLDCMDYGYSTKAGCLLYY